jgi:hypothetical protein
MEQRPTEFTVAGKHWSIEWVDHDIFNAEGAIHGDCDYSAQSIRISLKDCHADVIRDTLLHEVIHALNSIAGIKDGCNEEDIASRLTPLLLQTFRENESLALFLLTE